MKLVGDLLKYLTLAVAGLALCLGLWLASLLWHSPDYAATGTCTAVQIERTYVAIKAADSFRDAAQARTNYEFLAFHPHVRTLRGALERATNFYLNYWFGRKQTAAFVCNHALGGVDGQAADTVPHLVELLAPYELDETARWRLALCITSRGRKIGGPNGMAFAQVQDSCVHRWPWRQPTR